jgi:hypothetical protein
MAAISTAEEILEACRGVLATSPPERLPDLPISRLSGQPDWYPFENATWAVGEQIRQAFIRTPALRKRVDVLGAILDCAISQNLARGRQPFVGLLGHVAAQPLAQRVADLCADPDVNGHAVDTLIRMRASGHCTQVRPLLAAPQAWVRRKAKAYLTKFP